MSSLHKKRLIVLRGGVSPESSLSMQNGQEVLSIYNAHPEFEPLDVVITKSGEWMVHGYSRTPESVLANADVVFIALHGACGEDGAIQREIGRHNVPYVGARPYQSSIALHKMLTKEHLKDHEIRLSPHMRVTKAGTTNIDATAHMVTTLLNPRFILKPMRGGGGFGIHHAETTLDVAEALREMFTYTDDVLIEQFVEGKVVTVGTVAGLRNQAIYATPPVEIILAEGSTDILAAEKIAPGRFSKSTKVALEDYAKKVHSTLDLGSMSRADFVVTPDEQIFFLEVNTLPAVTRSSPLMSGMLATGVSQEELLLHLIAGAY